MTRKQSLCDRLSGRFFYCLISVLLSVNAGLAFSGPALTTVSDVVYRADGATATGTLVISWNEFTTADGKAVPAGEMSVALAPTGAINLALAPNEGATPDGSYYKVVYKLDGGSTSTEYWTVPATGPTTIAAVRASVVPRQVALQFGGKPVVQNPTATQTIAGSYDLVLGGGLMPATAGQELGGSGSEWNASLARVNTQGITDSGTSTFTGTTTLSTARFKGQPWYDITAYGAVCDGVTDDRAAIQAALDAAVAASGGVVYFPSNQTCVIGSTVSESAVHDITLLGHGTTLKGTHATSAMISLGDVTGATFSNRIRIFGLTLTDGAWLNGVYQAGQSTQDGIVLRSVRQFDIDVIAYNFGGRVAVIAGSSGTSPSEWGKVSVKSFDVGRALWLFQANNIEAKVNDRRSHQNAAYLWDCAQVDLMVLNDETLQPPSPISTDGIGVYMNAVSWSRIHGGVSGAYLQALKIVGNSKWNTIDGSFNDSSVLANNGTSNVVLDTDGTYTPDHNTFLGWYGWTGTVSATNHPQYGIQSVNSTNTLAIGMQGSGLGANLTSAGVGLVGGFSGVNGKAQYYNSETAAYEVHGQSAYTFDLDTDAGGGTPAFKVTAHNGTVNLLDCFDTHCVIGSIANAAGTGRLRFTNNQLLGWRNAANSADLTAGYNASNVFAISGSASIGGGTAITKHLSTTATLDFGNIAGAPNCASDQTITVTGAAPGDTVSLGIPAASVAPNTEFMAWVSAANTISVRACTFSGTQNPASGIFRVDVWQH